MASPQSRVSLILGANWNNEAENTVKQREIVQVARRNGIKEIDTARHYQGGESESYIGLENLASTFSIITKAPMCLTPFGATRDGIIENWERSAEALKTDHVAIYLLHVPDDATAISKTMDGVQALYDQGRFKEFGLSNFTAREVEDCYRYAKEKGYVLPTVYQAVYSVCSRSVEKDLFPTLRKLGIRVQAYSALASGFLVKTHAQIAAGQGNFSKDTVLGKILLEMYGGEKYLSFLESFAELAVEAGVSQAALAYRWMIWNSELKAENQDAVVIGASSAKQLANTVEEIEKGPLENWVEKRLSEMWRQVEEVAPGNNFGTYRKLMKLGAL